MIQPSFFLFTLGMSVELSCVVGERTVREIRHDLEGKTNNHEPHQGCAEVAVLFPRSGTCKRNQKSGPFAKCIPETANKTVSEKCSECGISRQFSMTNSDGYRRMVAVPELIDRKLSVRGVCAWVP